MQAKSLRLRYLQAASASSFSKPAKRARKKVRLSFTTVSVKALARASRCLALLCAELSRSFASRSASKTPTWMIQLVCTLRGALGAAVSAGAAAAALIVGAADAT